MTILLTVLMALGVGFVWAYLSPLAALLGGGVVLVFLLVGAKFKFSIVIWILSIIFYAYRFDVGPVTINLYRAIFLVLLIASVFRLGSLKIKNTKIYIYSGLLFGLFLMDFLRSSSSLRATSSFLNHVFGLGTLVYLVHFINDDMDLRLVVDAYLVVSIVVAGYGVYEGLSWFLTGARPNLPFVQYASTDIAVKTSMVRDLNLPRVESFFHDANLLGIFLVIAILILISRLQQVTNPLRYFFLFGVISVEIICVLFTASRSANGLLLISVLVFIFFQRKNSYKLSKLALVMFIIFVVALLFYTMMPILSVYVDAVFYRFSGGIGSRRLILSAEGWQSFMASPIFGVGLAQLESRLVVWTTHSFYLTILAQYGVVGALIVGGFVWLLIRRSIWAIMSTSRKNTDLAYALAAICLMVYQLVYDNLFSELMWLPFSILYAWALTKMTGERIVNER